MSQRIARPMVAAQQEYDQRAAGLAMLLLRVTLLGTLAAFIGVMCLSAWRVMQG